MTDNTKSRNKADTDDETAQKNKGQSDSELLLASQQTIRYSGPIPDPDTLVKYNSIIPNGANRIMKMAEKQQNQRIDIENKVIKSQLYQSKLGQQFGFIIGIFVIACGTFLSVIGQSTDWWYSCGWNGS